MLRRSAMILTCFTKQVNYIPIKRHIHYYISYYIILLLYVVTCKLQRLIFVNCICNNLFIERQIKMSIVTFYRYLLAQSRLKSCYCDVFYNLY